MSAEEWRAAPGFPAGYEVSNTGLVRRTTIGLNNHRPRILKGWIASTGYRMVETTGPGRKRLARQSVHRLVCEAFHGPSPSPNHVAAHYDGNPLNNHADNLRWASQRENHSDARRHGTFTAGERHGNSKITQEDVAEIRRLKEEGLTGAQIGERLGLNRNHVNRIAAGTAWAPAGEPLLRSARA